MTIQRRADQITREVRALLDVTGVAPTLWAEDYEFLNDRGLLTHLANQSWLKEVPVKCGKAKPKRRTIRPPEARC